MPAQKKVPEKAMPVNDVSVLRRTRVVALVLGVFMFMVLVAQLFKVQMVDYETYQQKAVNQQTRNEIITPARGTIYDRNMKELAISASVETVVISPADIEDEEEAVLIARGLSDILGMEDLAPGMVLTGVVRNVIDFGAFVDIGVHQDGLVHISQLGSKFVKHPSEVLAVGDVVEVKVLDVDVKKKRIALTMKL